MLIHRWCLDNIVIGITGIILCEGQVADLPLCLIMKSRYNLMKRYVFLFLSIISGLISADAQTFTQYIQQAQDGKGKVTITQSRDIEALVNGTVTHKVASQQGQTLKENAKSGVAANRSSNVQKTTKEGHSSNAVAKADSMEKARARERLGQEERLKAQKEAKARQNAVEEALALQRRIAEKAAEEKRQAAEKSRQAAEEKRQAAEAEAEAELHIPTVDMRKKVMRGARKVTGYRVQAFAGGNTRADKNKAQQIGNAIKMRFPDQPIYVHFYSPRWICRVGNYRSINEARRMLSAVKAMGYKSAVIVKGQISVFE